MAGPVEVLELLPPEILLVVVQRKEMLRVEQGTEITADQVHYQPILTRLQAVVVLVKMDKAQLLTQTHQAMVAPEGIVQFLERTPPTRAVVEEV
jgi:hypothetical protein